MATNQSQSAQSIKALSNKIKKTVAQIDQTTINLSVDLLKLKELLKPRKFNEWVEGNFGWGKNEADKLIKIAKLLLEFPPLKDKIVSWSLNVITMMTNAPKAVLQDIASGDKNNWTPAEIKKIIKQFKINQADTKTKPPQNLKNNSSAENETLLDENNTLKEVIESNQEKIEFMASELTELQEELDQIEESFFEVNLISLKAELLSKIRGEVSLNYINESQYIPVASHMNHLPPKPSNQHIYSNEKYSVEQVFEPTL